MSNRRHHLITYDIGDDKRRYRIFQHLKDYGSHAQFSVFFAELDQRELAEVRTRLRALMHAKEDQVLILDLGPEHNPLDATLTCLGRPYAPTPRCMIV